MSKKIEAWDIMTIARNPTRPTALDYISKIFEDFVELHGDRCFKDDKAMVCGIAMLKGKAYTIIAEQKGRNTKENIERFMKQAEKFKRPVITFIDTKGAYPGIGAEERGQGEAIAKSMMTMANLKVPIISIVIGEGSSGGALAIGVADEIIKEQEEDNLNKTSKKLQKEILSITKELEKLKEKDLLQNRYNKYRNMGEFVNI